MSSAKDIIIEDIFRSVTEDRTKTQGFILYHFKTIKSLRDINCDFELRFGFNDINPKFSVVFKIRHSYMYDYDYDTCDVLFDHYYKNDFELFNEEAVRIIIDEMLEIIPTLKFDLFTGKFVKRHHLQAAELDMFKDIEGLELKGEKCSICFEIVNTTSHCKHYLCVPCYQQIPLKKDEDDEDDDEDADDIYRSCPICRDRIGYTN
jgi:hypothetical protein